MNRLIVAFVFAAVTAFSCENDPTGPDNGNGTPFRPDPKLTQVEIPSALVEANTAFAFDLYPELLSNETATNTFISPLSISMAFMMAYNGAQDETAREMANVLRISDIPLDDLNYANAVLLSHLAYADEDVISEIANSVWARKNFPIKEDFIERIQTSYLAEAATRDFNDPETVDEINDWISERTYEKITEVLEPPIDPLTVMFLINAIYFNGTWTEEFDVDETTDRLFHKADGSTAPVPTMRRHDDMEYLSGDGFQAVRLPYGDGRFAGYVFLPDEDSSLDEFHAALTPENWAHWIRSFRSMEGTLYLPRFEFRYETPLNGPLTRLGMIDAFSELDADFSKITDEPLFISDARHLSYVRLDEEGTEAAAVTIIEFRTTSIMHPTFMMDVNRPFFFAIADSESGSILFMGSVYDPAED